MIKGYIQVIDSVSEFKEIIEKMCEAGVDPDEIVVNKSFDDFLTTVETGDCIVVQNLDFLNDIYGLINATTLLSGRGIDLKSLAQPWYSISNEMLHMLNGINEFNRHIRVLRTREGLVKAKANGKKLGRPIGTTKIADKIQAINKLRRDLKISIAEACEMVKCNPRSYYRHANNIL
ncbi:MAG: recombinase family protein [Muribaculaceae bacterium]